MTGTAGRGPTLRILVVEDYADAAESLALLLRLEGHKVTVASDGPSALRKAEQHPPDVALLDLGLPGMHAAANCWSSPGTGPSPRPWSLARTASA
jgi:CheY-like chemotaxis protein